MISNAQIRAARALLGWTQAVLAEASDISEVSIKNIESGKTDPRASTLAALIAAIQNAGVEFTNGDSPGVRLKSVSASMTKGSGPRAKALECPFVYADGKKCEGHVTHWMVYGPRRNHWDEIPFHKAKKVRLWCSIGDDHAGLDKSFTAKERMEYYPDRLPDEIREAIWPVDNEDR